MPDEDVQTLFFSATLDDNTTAIAKAFEKVHRPGIKTESYTLQGVPGEFAFDRNVDHYFVNVNNARATDRLKVLGDFAKDIAVPFVVFITVRHYCELLVVSPCVLMCIAVS